LFQLGYRVNVQLTELDLRVIHFRGEAGLGKIARIGIDSDDPPRAPALHLKRIEAGIAADVKHGLAREIRWNSVLEPAPLEGRVVSEKMIGRRLDAPNIEIVKPLAQFGYAMTNLLLGYGGL